MSHIEYIRCDDMGYKEGSEHTFPNGVKCEILGTYIKYNNGKNKDKMVKVRVKDTGYEKYVAHRHMGTCVIYDPLIPRISGVGYIGEGEYRARKPTREGGDKYKSYACWENMLWRVYGKDHQQSNRYWGRGASVCNEWHNLQTFVPWFLDNYPYKDGFTLDSDIFMKNGVKVYSPDTCVFIPQDINKFFAGMNILRGEYPIGVMCYGDDMFGAHVTHGHERSMRCSFQTPEAAFLWYKEKKESHLRELAKRHYEEGNINDSTYHKLLDWRAVPYPD